MDAELIAMIEEVEASDHSTPPFSELNEINTMGDMVECPACRGTGVELYYDDEGMEISREQWLLYPTSEREDHVQHCIYCHGEGLIEPENERRVRDLANIY